jgi:hypothetical protein
MNSLTIAYITARREPKFEWFGWSLINQCAGKIPAIIVVDSYADTERFKTVFNNKHVEPKPTVWQGKHRLTKEDWWAKSNAMNTAIILCETDFIAFVDDRSVLAPTWLCAVQRAMDRNYAVCGTYEKRANMKVESGIIVDEGELLGSGRPEGFGRTHDWWGGSYALPLEWCLAVNGWSEDVCDGLGSEDSQFGMTLRNSGYSMYYDSELKIIEDRTPTEIEGALKRADKNKRSKDDPLFRETDAKSWDIVRIFKNATSSQNSYDIRNMRARIQNGEPFPPPSAHHLDWYDGERLCDMT